jgi:hypothetical protein
MKSKAKTLVVLAATVALGLAACTGLQPASSSAADDLAGVWYYAGVETYLQLNEDGRFSFAETQQELEAAPFDAGQFRLEGISLTFITNDDSELCAGQIGTYEVELIEAGQLRFELQEDPCLLRRIGVPSGLWERVEP